MVVDAADPDQRAGRGIQRVDEALLIGDVCRVNGGSPGANAGTDHNRRAHAGLRRKRPEAAAGGGVERVHRSILAADEQAASGNGRLRPRRRGIREAKRPFQMQSWNAVDRQRGLVSGLEVRVVA